MRKLTVLYDASCGFCTRCRWWMERQPAYLELEFIPANAVEAARRFPSLAAAREELLAVDDEGGVYCGAQAFIICLYALKEYRELSIRISSPLVRPMARLILHLLSKGRRSLSRWLGYASETEIVRALQQVDPPSCVADSELSLSLEGAVCAVCGKPIDDRVSACRRCLAPHHPDCWVYFGKCATFGCGSVQYRRLRRAS